MLSQTPVDRRLDDAGPPGGAWARWVWIASATILGAGAGFVVAGLIQPRYRAETQILLMAAPRMADAAESPAIGVDVSSALAALQSSSLLDAVADSLQLQPPAEFATLGSILAEYGLRRAGEPKPLPPTDVAGRMRAHLTVQPVDDSRLIAIAYRAHDPRLARDVADAIASEYVTRQTSALPAAPDRPVPDGSGQRIADLAGRAKAADDRVAAAKAATASWATRNAEEEKRLAGLAADVAKARRSAVEAADEAQAIRQNLARGRPIAVLPAIAASPAMAPLLQREAALRAKTAELSRTLLEEHPRMKAARRDLAGAEAATAREAGAVAARLDATAADARRAASRLADRLDREKAAEDDVTGSTTPDLEKLERNARELHAQLEAALAADRQRPVPADSPATAAGTPPAQVAVAASLPAEPYFPDAKLFALAGAVIGFLLACLGVLLAGPFARSRRRRTRKYQWQDATPAADAAAAAGGVAEGPPLEVAPAPQATPATVDEIAEAVLTSGVARLFFVSPQSSVARRGSVTLARRLARADRSVVLVDFSREGFAAMSMGAEPLPRDEDDGAGFADIIHSDRLSSAHVISLSGIRAIATDSDGVELKLALDALGEAYDCVLAECGSLALAEIKPLIDAEAALLVSTADGVEDETRALLKALDDAGLDGVLLMRVEPGEGDAEAGS